MSFYPLFDSTPSKKATSKGSSKQKRWLWIIWVFLTLRGFPERGTFHFEMKTDLGEAGGVDQPATLCIPQQTTVTKMASLLQGSPSSHCPPWPHLLTWGSLPGLPSNPYQLLLSIFLEQSLNQKGTLLKEKEWTHVDCNSPPNLLKNKAKRKKSRYFCYHRNVRTDKGKLECFICYKASLVGALSSWWKEGGHGMRFSQATNLRIQNRPDGSSAEEIYKTFSVREICVYETHFVKEIMHYHIIMKTRPSW